jgi:hypothetical protein
VFGTSSYYRDIKGTKFGFLVPDRAVRTSFTRFIVFHEWNGNVEIIQEGAIVDCDNDIVSLMSLCTRVGPISSPSIRKRNELLNVCLFNRFLVL